MSMEEYKIVMADLEWLKQWHADREVLITFLEKFKQAVTENHANANR